MKILVHGWYHQDNLGDDLFIEAFQALFPQFEFKFSNQITLYDVQQADAVFIGGGSFLNEVPNVESNETYQALREKKLFYLGVGTETDINVFHHDLMSRAQLIATRSPHFLDKVKKINPKTIAVPDLVYYLQPTKTIEQTDRSVLIIPNISVVPHHSDPQWKHAAWNYFKSEFVQFLDGLVGDNYTIGFLPLCTNFRLDDSMAAAEIVSHMVHRSNTYLLPKKNTLSAATETISRYNVVITQRYHGIVLAEMLGSPCLSIYHHDKLKNSQGPSLPFYGITKDKLRTQFDQLVHTKVSQFLPIDRDMFVQLQQAVLDALGCDQKQQSTDSI